MAPPMPNSSCRRSTGSAHLVAISSASVYRDAAGRTLDEAAANGFPDLPEPIDEAHPIVEPGPATYSTRKIAMEHTLLDRTHCAATILWPCAIYGIGSRHPREWWVVKRLLEGRRRIPLAYGGTSRFHPTAADNIAALVAAVAVSRTGGVFNIADESTPTAADMVRLIADRLDREVAIDCFEGAPIGPVGRHPWAIPRPFLLSINRAKAIGYTPAADYEQAITPYLEWLTGAEPERWRTAFPQLARYPYDLFDYAAEDAVASGVARA
jgi:nucleoside-diphosphate-sugar epimerase